MKSQWILKQQDSKLADELSGLLNIHPVTAKILINRGVKNKEEIQKFLKPTFADLPDPYLLQDMDKATHRIITAIKAQEKITVYGDYDTDGITSAALLVRFFKDCGISIDYYIPHRLLEGYGLNKKGIDEIKRRGSTLIITTDNGTNSHSEIEYANSMGIDVVVTDHHEPPAKLPLAKAIVNPKLEGSDKQFKVLAGVGVAFYLAIALRSKLRKEEFYNGPTPNLASYLDFVTLGTIADVVPLTGLNRTLVKHGMEILKKTTNIGLCALAEAASTDITQIDATQIAFRLSPRINAAGRLGNQNLGMELLLSESKDKALKIAQLLNQINTKRQTIEKKITLSAIHAFEEKKDTKSSIVLWSDEWHPGVIGIAASRLAEKYQKPCAIISLKDGVGRGSVRSIGGFNVTLALENASETLINYGGHPAAAGFDIKAEKLDLFSEKFEEYVSKHLSEEDRATTLELDANLDLSDINEILISELEMLSPFGEGNLTPLFGTPAYNAKNVKIVGKNHLKFQITDKLTTLNAIGFNLGDFKLDKDVKYQFAGTPQFNYWNGLTSIQFKLKDIKPVDL